MTEKEQIKEQSTISEHSQFDDFIFQGLKSGGVHVVASKSHGKSRLLFSIAKHLQKQINVKVVAFDGSETWLYAFSKISVFTIGEHDILASNLRSTDEIERYSLENWNLVKLALDSRKDILFRLKTRKPSKRGFFVRTVVNYLDAIQRAEKSKTATHECTKAIAYFIEEAQDKKTDKFLFFLECFNSRSTARNDTEEFLTVFNEGRNNRESFFTASQRLTDFSKTIRAKQLSCIGKLNNEDITPSLRRIEKTHNLDFSKMKDRTWFFEGKTFVSPEFKQELKPYQINKDIKAEWLSCLPKTKTLSLKEKIKLWLNPSAIKDMAKPLSPENLENNQNSFFENESLEKEIEEENNQEKENEEFDLETIEEEWIN